MKHQLLENKAAVVTGAAQGIGYAIARRFVAEGARVAILDIDLEKAEQAADELGASAFRADVTDAASVESAFAGVAARFGSLDILVNNAGIVGSDTPVRDLDEADWNRVLDVNLTGTFLCSREAVRHMIPAASREASCRWRRSPARRGTPTWPPTPCRRPG